MDKSDWRFVAIDVETTGLDSATNRVTDLAAVLVGNGVVWGSMIRPGDRTPTHSNQLRAPTFAECVSGLFELLTAPDVVVVSHNVRFDVDFLACELERCGAQLPRLRTLDTRELSTFLTGDGGRLEDLCEKYGVLHIGGHSAVTDARSTAGLLDALLDLGHRYSIDICRHAIRTFEGPTFTNAAIPLATAAPVPRDPERWKPFVHKSRGPSEDLAFTVSLQDIDITTAARDVLGALLDDENTGEADRVELAALLALDDTALLGAVNERMSAQIPSEAEQLEEEFSEVCGTSGMVGLRRREALVDRLRGTAHESDIVREIFELAVEHLDLISSLDALRSYLDEPTVDTALALAVARSIVVTLVRDGCLNLAAAFISEHPCVLDQRNSSGSLNEELARLSYSVFADGNHPYAIEVARWAVTLAADDAERTERRATLGHQLERDGRRDEALGLLLEDWDAGRRSLKAADRISLMAKRAGDTELARRVLSEAIDSLPHTTSDRGADVLEPLRKRLAKLG